ncbi:acyloxyacyl hydrolase [Marinobacterium arenosum]|uniref:acyloxyacyl hydrolase n=1 Tax=Marinobacterium arenosum TaxID=2862496 RepID=UPI001C942891|nr:acyloxyacyl hydrolase [Marinobacterium arenosum]MBY4675421.1 acyloxyacyl hydrolase [Marinobacterium arenosum]
MIKRATIFATLLAAGFSPWLQAGSLVLGGGAIADLDNDAKPLLQLAYEAEPQDAWWSVQPYGELLVSEHSTSYLGLGLQKAFPLSDHWDWGLGINAGYYHSNDHQLDLGYDVEFRSRLFVDYRLDQQQRVRLEIGHISNAELGDDNPGTEVLLIDWIRAL